MRLGALSRVHEDSGGGVAQRPLADLSRDPGFGTWVGGAGKESVRVGGARRRRASCGLGNLEAQGKESVWVWWDASGRAAWLLCPSSAMESMWHVQPPCELRRVTRLDPIKGISSVSSCVCQRGCVLPFCCGAQVQTCLPMASHAFCLRPIPTQTRTPSWGLLLAYAWNNVFVCC